jgi:ubiquinone/menaquinone biosynthesis C-methylase UbiE
MTGPLGGFDPQRTYDTAAQDYVSASEDFWRYVPMRSVERLGLQPGEHVLDVPCGPGPSLVAAARAVGPQGRVVGIDYAPQMVAIAERRAAESRVDTIEVRVGDMTAIEPPAVPFDAVTCALGVFFVDDMASLVRSLLELTHPETGRLLVSVFGEEFFEPMRSVFVAAVEAVAPDVDVIEPWRRTEHEDTLQGLFDGAGVDAGTIVTDDDHLPLRDPADWWGIVMGSGLRRTAQLLDDGQAREVRARCEAHIAERGIRELTTTTRYALAGRVHVRE